MDICDIRNYMNYEYMTAANKDYRRMGVVWYRHYKPKKEGKLASRITLLQCYIGATYWLCEAKQVTILTTRPQM